MISLHTAGTAYETLDGCRVWHGSWIQMESRRKQQHIHASLRKQKVIPACFQVNQDKNQFSTSKTMYVNSVNMMRAIDDITM